jgi:hypothetical protein
LALNYCHQSGLGYNSAESFNFGINKDFWHLFVWKSVEYNTQNKGICVN